jgi:hypothetical protein
MARPCYMIWSVLVRYYLILRLLAIPYMRSRDVERRTLVARPLQLKLGSNLNCNVSLGIEKRESNRSQKNSE